MIAIGESLRGELENEFGERVRFDLLERKCYSHDVGEMPKLVKPLVDAGLAGGVVRPSDEDELVWLVKWAARNNIPLVPRGASTSGYGGVLPRDGQLVVDMSAFAEFMGFDLGEMTATVGGAAIWENVERALAKESLALRLYPSSTPSSTVAGWLAQGGAGFGSYEYGFFKENVKSAAVVLPDGSIREFAGDELTKIADAEGTTGFITQVTIDVRPLEEERVRAVAFEDTSSLEEFISGVREQALPVWSLTFINPTNVRLKAQIPLPIHEGHEAPPPIPLPEAYIAIIAYPASRRTTLDNAIEKLAARTGGGVLSDDQAEQEWEERFRPMKAKRIAPTMIPMETIVPAEALADVFDEMSAQIKHPLVMEGMVKKGDEVVLLGFVPHDVRRLSFNFAFGLTLTAIKIAEAHGGRVYSTGLYFRHKAKDVLGDDGVAAYLVAKNELDPAGIMNPGKIVGNGALGTLMNVAGAMEPVVRSIANSARASVGQRFDGGKGIVPGDVAWYAQACVQCGYCVHTCDQYYGRGWESDSPRGKYYYLRELLAGRESLTQTDVNRFLVCTTCEECSVRCQIEMPVEESWKQLRGRFIDEDKRMTFPPFEMMRAALEGEGNIWARYRANRDAWVPDDMRAKIRPKADVCYFAGCTASYVEPDIAEASLRLLDAAGVEFTTMGTDENCCGIPMLVAGRWDTFESNMRYNIEKMRETGAKTIVSSCPSCHLVWAQLYPEWAAKLGIEYDFEVKHYSEVLTEKIASGELKFTHEVPAKVTFHDSCHFGRALGIYDPPRELIEAIPGVELVEMEHNHEEALCCGSVVTLVGEPHVAPVIGSAKVGEAQETGADAVLALCPCCEVQMRLTADKMGAKMPVKDLASFAVQGLGYEMTDSTSAAIEAWGPFEKFIDLMQPRAMADLMEALFPPMFAAMPRPLGAMMDFMKKVPGGLAIMKPMMPLMLPRLVPTLMPKVMPEMIEEVERRTGPLPDFMAEQMPDLLPKTMDALMPNMLPLITPYIVPKMMEYIKAN